MEKIDLIRALVARNKGTSLSVVVNRPAKLRKAASGLDIRKRSRFSLQLASYAARKPVKQAVEAGDRQAPELPSWVSHAEDIGNGLRFWIGKNGQIYLALPRFGSKAESEWLENGKPVPQSKVAAYLLASETRKRESKEETEAKGQAGFNAIKLENIEAVA